MINIEHLDKTYHLKNADVHAVDDVSLHIESGQIYGVIGYSGAGKSTLVRCLNFLEIPDSGSIEIEGFGKVNASQGNLDISQKKLRELRRSIGMIFQEKFSSIAFFAASLILSGVLKSGSPTLMLITSIPCTTARMARASCARSWRFLHLQLRSRSWQPTLRL